MSELIFKIASTTEEFAQIERLNHRTFAEEIAQHVPRDEGMLRDKFHDENLYFIALREETLVGMLALRDRRPFSLDTKLENLDEFLPPYHKACEVRLLAVSLEERHGFVLRDLLRLLADYCIEQDYDLALISGTTRQQKLYAHLGFVPFGPLVGTEPALFQPMYLTRHTFEKLGLASVNLLPGPVPLRPCVKAALQAPPLSHRAPEFHRSLHQTQEKLKALTNASYVAIAVGTGTLANDMVAAQLGLLDAQGLVLSNGEFGERLIDHARRAGVNFQTHSVEWGKPFNWAQIESLLQDQTFAWLWTVHCETSTGVLNDLETLSRLAQSYEVRLCLDCVSSLGAMSLNLQNVYLASGSSGKALGAPAGLALIFSSYQALSAQILPRYLDLGLYHEEITPFTHSAPLVTALKEASEFQHPQFWQHLADASQYLRACLEKEEWTVVAPSFCAAPFVITIALPPALKSAQIGAIMEKYGYNLSYRSRYLAQRNWIQACMMSEMTQHRLRLDELPLVLRRAASICS